MPTAPTDQSPIVTTADGFLERWRGRRNFLMDLPELDFDMRFPSVEAIADALRNDPETKSSAGTNDGYKDFSSVREELAAMPMDRMLERPFQMSHYQLDRFFGPGCILEGFRERVLEPWQAFLRSHGFDWYRCYPIIRVSGRHSVTGYHVDRSNVLFWQVAGHKRFVGLADPQRWAPAEDLVDRRAIAALRRPEALTVVDEAPIAVAPGQKLWNCLLTPHWVTSGDEVTININLSHGGLRRDGRYSENETLLQAWYERHPEERF